MSLNEGQRRMAETLEGIVCVDAGPGTGKTHTITRRYINVLRKGVQPEDILMVTFTRNSAAEMRDRIRRGLTEAAASMDPSDPLRAGMIRSCDSVRTSTFDAYCLRILLSSPDEINDFFGFDEQLSRGARLVENDTLNKGAFRRFYSEFAKNHGHLYKGCGDIPAVVAGDVDGLYSLIEKLMSNGIIPVKGFEWFSDGEKRLIGDPGLAMEGLRSANTRYRLGRLGNAQYPPGTPQCMFTKNAEALSETLMEEELTSVACEDRSRLIEFLWFVYYEYIRDSVRANRLTFSLVKILSFAVLYQSGYAREINSTEYLMVDEFQDTDEMQMKICLMLLRKGNFCVVGDWKQGIYGFRNASVDNILRFREKVNRFCSQLGSRVLFDPGETEYHDIRLEVNYRGTDAVLDPAFKALGLKGSRDDVVQTPESAIVELTPFKGSADDLDSAMHSMHTGFSCCSFADEKGEYEGIVDMITEYVYSGRYKVVEGGRERAPSFGDVAVLFRNTGQCTAFYETAVKRRLPVFLQGEVEIMRTKPGKIALAWLRFVGSIDDRRATTAILTYEGYPMSEIARMYRDARSAGEDGRQRGMASVLPEGMIAQRGFLERKSRRPNDLLTSIFAYYGLGCDGVYDDIVQAIVNVLSGSFRGSLITISDLIRLMEEDIAEGTRYNVDAVLGRSAVTVQTMHKSKGLEYPIVVVGGVNSGKMPSTKGSRGLMMFDDGNGFGIRCRREAATAENGMEGVFDSWRFKVISNSLSKDYDEERRLFFVAMTRAKQYLFVTSSGSPSMFFDGICEGAHHRPVPFPVSEGDRTDAVSDPPGIPGYRTRRRNIAVHDIMSYKSGADSGKGTEYGILVHEAAQQMLLGKPFDGSLPEMERVHSIIEGLGHPDVLKAELPCTLPVGDVTLRGVIDLYAEYPARAEVHDYKTDSDTRNLDAYAVQLSVYAIAVERATGKKARCFADFVSLGCSIEIDPIPFDEISERVESLLSEDMVL